MSERAHLEIAACALQRFWRSHLSRRVYRMLVSVLRRAELLSASEVVSAADPAEAKLLSDAGTSARVRLRLAGERFPPSLVYKVYVQGHVQYLKGPPA